MSIAVVDSGVANLTSVMAALKRLGAEGIITSEADKIREASHVILPGVGAASSAMEQLNKKNLCEVLRGLKQPVLGICLGMQILFEKSEESGGCACLAIIPGKVCRLNTTPDIPIPHMGWNELLLIVSDHPLFRDIKDRSFMYFVHSFAAPVSETTLAACSYGQAFTAAVGYKNFFGCQFHPERSSIEGSRVLKNFLEM